MFFETSELPKFWNEMHEEGCSWERSPTGGNLVDGLPSVWNIDGLLRVCHNTETTDKPARLGPAENGTAFVEICRFNKLLVDDVQENLRKPCQSYIEDQYRCV